MRGRKTEAPAHIETQPLQATASDQFTPKSRSRPRGNFFFERRKSQGEVELNSGLSRTTSHVSFESVTQCDVPTPKTEILPRIRSHGVIWKQDFTPLTSVPGGNNEAWTTPTPLKPTIKRRNSLPLKSVRPLKLTKSFVGQVPKIKSAPHLSLSGNLQVPNEILKWLDLMNEPFGFDSTPISAIHDTPPPIIYVTDAQGVIQSGKLKGQGIWKTFSKQDTLILRNILSTWTGKATEDIILAGRLFQTETGPAQLVLTGNGSKTPKFTFRISALSMPSINVEMDPTNGKLVKPVSALFPPHTHSIRDALPGFGTETFSSLDAERFKFFSMPLPPYIAPQTPLEYAPSPIQYASPTLLQPLSRGPTSFALRVHALQSSFCTAIPLTGPLVTLDGWGELIIPPTTDPIVLDGLKLICGYSRKVLLGSSVKQWLHLPGFAGQPGRALEKRSVSGFFVKQGTMASPFEPPRQTPWQPKVAWGLVKHRDGGLIPVQLYLDRLSGDHHCICLIKVDAEASQMLQALGQALEPRWIAGKRNSDAEMIEQPTYNDEHLWDIGCAVGPSFGSPGAFGFVRRGWKLGHGPVVVKSVRMESIPLTRFLESRLAQEKLGVEDVSVPVELGILLQLVEFRHKNLPQLLDFTWKGDDVDYFHLVFNPLATRHATCDAFDLMQYFIEKGKPMNLSMVRNIWMQVVEAVAWLHSHGIVHRDIKDENVVCSYRFGDQIQVLGVQLVDFGSAALLSERVDSQINVSLWNGWDVVDEDFQSVSVFDTFVGTLEWAAPEILRGVPYSGPLQDAYSLGLLLYTLIYREPPFATAVEMMERRGQVEFPYEYEVYSKDKALWNCMCGLLRVDAREGDFLKDGQVKEGCRWTLNKVLKVLQPSSD
jgi:hypothetical protein